MWTTNWYRMHVNWWQMKRKKKKPKQKMVIIIFVQTSLIKCYALHVFSHTFSFFFFSSWTRLAISKSLRATVASPFFFLPFCSTSVSFSFYGFSHFHCNSRHISLRFMRQPRWKPETKQQTKQKCDRKKRINKTTREKKIRKNVSWRGKKW